MFIVVDKPSCMTEMELHGRGDIEDIKSVDAMQSLFVSKICFSRDHGPYVNEKLACFAKSMFSSAKI
jgi:hypothetical protein